MFKTLIYILLCPPSSPIIASIRLVPYGKDMFILIRSWGLDLGV